MPSMSLEQVPTSLLEQVPGNGRREEVKRVLHKPEADHNERLWLAGYLKDVAGFSVDETLTLIDEETRWSDYDREVTAYFIGDLYGVSIGSPPDGSGGNGDGNHWKRAEEPFDHWFADGALECWVETDSEGIGRRAFYRTVEGDDHTLLVIDLEAPKHWPLSAMKKRRVCWNAAQGLVDQRDWWVVKFSGNRGFHVIDKLDGEWSPDELEAEARKIVDGTGFDPSLVDWSIYTRKRKIRMLDSPHLGSGLRSAQAYPDDRLADVMERARGEGGAGDAASEIASEPLTEDES